MRDGHHVLHHRQEWRLRDDAKYIREHHSLVPVIHRDVHEALHRACPAVPALGYYALKRTRYLWVPDDDTMTSLDNLQFAMQEAGLHPAVHPLERQFLYLVIHAIDLQKPFIQEGLIPREEGRRAGELQHL